MSNFLSKGKYVAESKLTEIGEIKKQTENHRWEIFNSFLWGEIL